MNTRLFSWKYFQAWPDLACIIFFIFFLLTTRFPADFDQGTKRVHFDDAPAYIAMAKAVPGLPPPHSVLEQHAQRIFVHAIVGTVTNITKFNLSTVYWSATILLIGCIVYLLIFLIHTFDLNFLQRILLYGLFFLNPYTIRPFFLAPSMLSDLVFVNGLLLLLIGIRSASIFWIIFGLILGQLGRQNMAPLSLAVALWAGLGWHPRLTNTSHRWSMVPLSLLSIALTHFGTLWITHGFTRGSSVPSSVLTSLASWIFSDKFQLKLLLEHIIRILLPLSFFGALITFSRFSLATWMNNKTWVFWLLLGAILIPSFLIDPILQQKSETRYTALGIAIAIAIVAQTWSLKNLSNNNEPISVKHTSKIATLGVFALLCMSSLHHLHAINPWKDKAELFMVAHLIMALFFGVMLRKIDPIPSA